MAREKESFRHELEQINNQFPSGQDLSITDVCRYLGRCYNTVVKRYPEIKEMGGCTKVMLAHLISERPCKKKRAI